MQFFKPENYFMVREALLKAGRQELIGSGCDCLIPAHRRRQPCARMEKANESLERRGVRPPDPESRIQQGLPTGRKTARRRTRSTNGKAAVQARDHSQQLTALSNASGSPRMLVEGLKSGP